MEKNVILNNGVKMPVIGLGTYNAEDLNKLEISIKQSIEMGYRHIDTASFYGNEDVVGVSNFNVNHLEILMEDAEIIPAVNQIEFHDGFRIGSNPEEVYEHPQIILD